VWWQRRSLSALRTWGTYKVVPNPVLRWFINHGNYIYMEMYGHLSTEHGNVQGDLALGDWRVKNIIAGGPFFAILMQEDYTSRLRLNMNSFFQVSFGGSHDVGSKSRRSATWKLQCPRQPWAHCDYIPFFFGFGQIVLLDTCRQYIHAKGVLILFMWRQGSSGPRQSLVRSHVLNREMGQGQVFAYPWAQDHIKSSRIGIKFSMNSVEFLLRF